MGFSIDFVDVGQGDCSVVSFPDGTFTLIDVGPRASPIVDWLAEPQQMRRKCRSIVLTHNDADHAGALTSILASNRPDFGVVYMLTDRSTDDHAFSVVFRKALELKAASRLTLDRLEASPTRVPLWTDGNIELRVLFPTYADNTTANNPNRTSGIIALFIGNTLEVVWAGDAALASLHAAVGGMRPRWVVGPHHGAPIDFRPARNLVPQIAPRRSYLSLGSRNRYGHPKRDFVFDLAAEGCRVTCSEITRSCHTSAEQAGFKVLDGNSLLGFPPVLGGNPCRGAVRLVLASDQMVVDRWDIIHLERVEKLRRPMCLNEQ